jgi:hypothetical protein
MNCRSLVATGHSNAGMHFLLADINEHGLQSELEVWEWAKKRAH